MNIVWLNGNFAGHYKRSTAVGFALSVGNTSGVVVGQIFTAKTAPRYLYGIKVVLGFTAVAMVLIMAQTACLHWVNKKRKARVAARDPSVLTGADNAKKKVTDFDDDFVYTL